jgi:hypothetical protein
MQNGRVAIPKRSEHGGESVVFWVNSAEQAALRRYAEQHPEECTNKVTGKVSTAIAAKRLMQQALTRISEDQP